MIKNAILIQRKNDKTDQTEWALVSKKDRKVLKWFGAKKPSDEAVQKEEKRIQYFKNQGERIDRIKKLAMVPDFLNEYYGEKASKIKLVKVKDVLDKHQDQIEFANFPGIENVTLAIVPDNIWKKQGKDWFVPSESAAEENLILVQESYFNSSDDIAWLVHELTHCGVYSEDYKKRSKEKAFDIVGPTYPNNMVEKDTFTRQFQFLKNKGKSKQDILNSLKEYYDDDQFEFFHKLLDEIYGDVKLSFRQNDLIKEAKYEDVNAKFYYAVKDGDLEKAKEALDGGADINAYDSIALKIALESNDLGVLNLLVANGLKPTEETLNRAVYKGNTELVKLFVEKYGLKPTEEMLYIATDKGNTELVKLFVEKYGLKPTEEMLYNVALYGNIELVKLFVEKYGLKPTEEIFGVVSQGNTELVKLFIEKYGFKLTEEMLNNAISKENTELVKLFIEKHGLKPTEEMLDRAVYKGNAELVKLFVEKHGLKPTEEMLDRAVYKGNTELVKLFVEKHGLKPTEEMLNEAVYNECIELVKLFVEQYGLKPTEAMLYRAINYGNIELVKLFVEKYGLKPTEKILNQAVDNGHVELVKLFVEKHGLKPTEEMLDRAVYKGNTELVKLFVEKYGLKPTEEMLNNEIFKDNAELVKLFVEKYGLKPTEEMLNSEIFKDNAELVKLFVEKYGLKPTEKMLNRAVYNGHVELVKLFVEKYGLKPTEAMLNRAVYNGHTELAKLFVEQYGLKPTEEMFNRAIFNGHTELAKLFVEQYGLKPTEEMLNRAVSCRCIELVKLFVEQYGLKPTEETLNRAVDNGYIELVKLFVEKYGLKPTEKTFNLVVYKGNTKLTKLFVEKYGLKPTEEMLNEAVYKGNAELVDFFKKFFFNTQSKQQQKKDKGNFLSKTLGPVYEDYKNLGYNVEKHLGDSWGVLEFLHDKKGTITVKQKINVPDWFRNLIQSSNKYSVSEKHTIEDAWTNGILEEVVKTQQGDKIRPVKIGKILNEVSAKPEEKKEFEERKLNIKTFNWIIKADPKNILMMTQGRGWESGSCARPGGAYERGPLKDACVGSAIIYFYKPGANTPCGREIIRPSVSKDGKPFIIRGDRIYGDGAYIPDKDITTRVPVLSGELIPKDSYIYGMHGERNDLYLDSNPNYESKKAPGKEVLKEIGEKFTPFRDQDSTPKESKEIMQHLSKRQKEDEKIKSNQKPLGVSLPPEEEKRIEQAKKFMGEEVGYANDGLKLSNRHFLTVKEAADPTKKTADSLFKIIQFLLYRFPENDKRKYLGRAKGKIVNLNPAELSGKKMSPSAVIGQAVSLSKNLLSGLNPIFVGKVLEELIRMLSA